MEEINDDIVSVYEALSEIEYADKERFNVYLSDDGISHINLIEVLRTMVGIIEKVKKQ